jgi:hypothetical protein
MTERRTIACAEIKVDVAYQKPTRKLGVLALDLRELAEPEKRIKIIRFWYACAEYNRHGG